MSGEVVHYFCGVAVIAVDRNTCEDYVCLVGTDKLVEGGNLSSVMCPLPRTDLPTFERVGSLRPAQPCP